MFVIPLFLLENKFSLFHYSSKKKKLIIPLKKSTYDNIKITGANLGYNEGTMSICSSMLRHDSEPNLHKL